MPKAGVGDSRHRRNMSRYLWRILVNVKGVWCDIPRLKKVEVGRHAGEGKLTREDGRVQAGIVLFFLNESSPFSICVRERFQN
jgi:hypothetical protein